MRVLIGWTLLLLAGIAATAEGQSAGQSEVPAVNPGGVATVLARLTAVGEPGDSVSYRVEMAEGFNLFAPATGTWSIADTVLQLPLTFGVSPTAEAGLVEAGRVVARWADGTASSVPVSVQIRARHELNFWVGRRVITGAPQQPIEFTYHLRNRGNVLDTVAIAVRAPAGWERAAIPDRAILAPGDTASGTIQLVPPREESPGSETIIGVDARGGRVLESESVRFVSLAETNWFGDLASLPSTVFLGSTPGSEGLGGIALRAGGEVREGTRVNLQLRHNDQVVVAPALRNHLTGPEFRLQVDHRRMRVAAGDVFSQPDLFTGPSLHGSGLDLRWSGAARGGALLVAAPSNGLGQEEGRLLRASGYVSTGVGRFTAVLSDVRRDALLVEGYGVRSAGVRYDLRQDGGGRLAVQAGLMQVTTDTSGSALGPAVEAEYYLIGEAHSLTARLRRVPATTPRTAAHGDELLVSGNAGLIAGLSAVGWGYVTRSPLVGIDDPGRSWTLATGLRYAYRPGTQFQLTGQVRDADAPYLGTSSGRRTVRATLDAPVGPLALELDGEIGRAETRDSTAETKAPFRQARGGLRWNTGRDWAWLGIVYRDPGTRSASTFASMSGGVQLGTIELQGGLNVNADLPLDDGLSLWTGTSFAVTPDAVATLGIDYSPVGVGDPWRLSIGVSRRFALPLPLSRQPAVRGVVYEDNNGNRVRDPGESTLPNATVRLGVLSTETDADGRFAFLESVQGPLRLETTDLPLGLMVPADVHLPTAGVVAIPVVRTAALELTLFLDRDNDGVRDEAEEPAAGVVVSLVAANGRVRDVAADADGRVRISAVSPGEYTLRIHPPATRTTAAGPIERSLVIEPGTTLTETFPVPVRQREVRIPDAQRLENLETDQRRF